MSRIDKRFLYVAIVYGIAAMIIGVWLGITENLELRPLHAHLGLLGWVSLAIFGLAYRVCPAARGRSLCEPAFLDRKHRDVDLRHRCLHGDDGRSPHRYHDRLDLNDPVDVRISREPDQSNRRR